MYELKDKLISTADTKDVVHHVDVCSKALTSCHSIVESRRRQADYLDDAEADTSVGNGKQSISGQSRHGWSCMTVYIVMW